MRKYIIWMLAVLLCVSLSFGLNECKNIQPPAGIPCQVTTIHEPTPPCNTYTATIFNSSGTNITILNLTNFGNSSFCRFNFTFTAAGSYTFNMTTRDTGNIIVEAEDNMTSLSVTLFILLINAALFFAPIFIRFSKNPALDNLMKKTVWMGGLAFLIMNNTIIVSLAENAGLGISNELFFYQQIFLWMLYAGFIFLFFNTIITTLNMWKIERKKKTMGES